MRYCCRFGVGSVCVALDEPLLAVAVDADEDGADGPGGEPALIDPLDVMKTTITVARRTQAAGDGSPW
jgi:hypothetical protein